MKRALFFTAYDRPEYLAEVLKSWESVRGLDRWHVVGRVEPGRDTDLIVSMFTDFFDRLGLTDTHIVVNPYKFGVLHHPWVGFWDLFNTNYDFVARTEDDLLVGEDILEYFEWASEYYAYTPGVTTVHGFSVDAGGNPEEVHQLIRYNPLVWGTWKAEWVEILSPTWDHTYSTFNGTPGNEAGFDWNLDTRIYPKFELTGVYPLVSRVSNIGFIGTHSTPENYYNTEEFLQHTDPVTYRVKES